MYCLAYVANVTCRAACALAALDFSCSIATGSIPSLTFAYASLAFLRADASEMAGYGPKPICLDLPCSLYRNTQVIAPVLNIRT